MFQVFHLDVAKVDIGYCICCNDNIRILQVYVLSVSGVFRRMFQVFYLDVAYVVMTLHTYFERVFKVFHMFHTYITSVLSRCCISRFRCHMLLCLYTHVSSVSYVSDVCCKCFI
jgi:hypothetical protein